MRSKLFFLSLIASMYFGTPLSVYAAANVGDLVMCEDSSTVYFLAEDGNRYGFPNESIYFSWYKDFDEVKNISCEDLASLPLVGNVVYQAGTTLVKLLSVPTVYAVESNGVLRAIGSEEQAKILYGDDWQEFVDDLPDTFFSSFEIGDDLADGELPEGMMLIDEEDNLFRIEDDGSAVEIDDALDGVKDEELLADVAEPFNEVESRISIEISVSSLSDLSAEVLQSLLELLQTVDVDSALEIDVDIKIEEEEELENDEGEEEIDKAIEEIGRAEEKIAERESDGEDVTESQSFLATAEDLLTAAQDAYASGDYTLAEDFAGQAQDSAEDARMGSAVSSLGDDEDEDEGDTENGDEESIEEVDDGEDVEDQNDSDNEVDDDTEEDVSSESGDDDGSDSDKSDESNDEDGGNSDEDSSGSSEDSGGSSDSSGSGGGESDD